VFPPMSTVYVTTTAGNWPLKSIGWQVDLNYELAAAPATRRTYKFNDPLQNGMSSLALVDNGTTLNVTPIATGDPSPPTLVVNTTTAGDALGLGVASTLDDALSAENQRRIDGSLGEALHISFDEDVTLESITLDNLNLNGTESMVLSLVSGTNPFTGLGGYTGDYSLGADSLTYTTSAGGRRPSVITFGMNGQDPIEIEAGTVLALTANPAAGGGFLLDMITAHVSTGVDADADFDDDGDVDGDDLATWRGNFGTAATDATGDANADGVADGADFLQWQQEVAPPAPPWCWAWDCWRRGSGGDARRRSINVLPTFGPPKGEKPCIYQRHTTPTGLKGRAMAAQDEVLGIGSQFIHKAL
jgi:hypothetical protein